ncbi:glycosyltransferase [Hymenobacter sp. BT730]|uniref:glycosyltransferase n=1 Tax=Hymenobacter sp. BT730 TaxID=3063332 RepID=UPI0026E086C1|nr:glycosyltransferase [Hymenobacter sp. BT730]
MLDFSSTAPLTQSSIAQPADTAIRYRLVAGTRQMRWLVFLGVLCLVQFIYWFANPEHIGYAPLFWMLAFSVGFKLLRLAHEWYHYVNVREPILPPPPARQRTVDMLTTACPGEPRDMIVHTLEAMQAVTYPHTSYLCDEGNDPYLRQVCELLGVVHVTRQVKVDAKAGNINNALRQATGEFCVVLDPDHAPTPDFLDKVMAYFENPEIGFVQVVQAYGNQQESLVARGAAEQTYHFYGPLMMGMNSYGTAQAIGANCTFRRAALDSIGGHAAGLTEDMHTAMRLHAQGWKSVYAPVVVSRGLAPSSLGAYYSQQLKWSRGCFDLLFHVYPKLFSKFTWRQRVHYFTLPLYFLSGIVALIDLFVPLLGLWLSKFPWHVSIPSFVAHMMPLMGIGMLIRLSAQRWLREPHERGLHLTGGLLRIGTWWIYSLGFFYTLLNVKVPYIPTPKEGEVRNEWRIALPNMLMVVASLALAAYGLRLMHDAYGWMLAGLAMLNAGIMVAAVLMGQQALLHKLQTRLTHAQFIKPLMDMAQQEYKWIHGSLLPAVPRIALPAALFLVFLGGAGQWKIGKWIIQRQRYTSELWLLTGDDQVRTGHILSTPEEPTTLASYYPFTPQTSKTEDFPLATEIIGLDFPAAAFPTVAAPRLENYLHKGQMPMLSWVVPEGALLDTAWQAKARILARFPRPLMFRPQIQARSARQYRRTWQKLVNGLRKAGVGQTIWVWTPPATDSLTAYYPGIATVDWLCIDNTPSNSLQRTTSSYASFRHQAATRSEFHQTPVMVILPMPAQEKPARLLQRLTERYPEVKAVVFGPMTQQATLPLEQKASLSRPAPVDRRVASLHHLRY